MNFKVNRKYVVINGDPHRNGNIIQITSVEPDRIYYTSILGNEFQTSFTPNSEFAKWLVETKS